MYRSGIDDKSINAITIAQPTAEGGYIDVAKVGTEVPAQPGKHSLKLPANIVPNDNCKYHHNHPLLLFFVKAIFLKYNHKVLTSFLHQTFFVVFF